MFQPQSLLTKVPFEELTEDMQALYTASMETVGEAERISVFGHHPALYHWYIDNFYRKLFENSEGTMRVDPRWKELIRLKMSLTHGCFVCNTGNIPSALAAGFSQAKIDHVLDPSLDYFSEQELAILDLGDQIVMHHVDGSLTPDLHARLAKYFDDGEILELGLIAAILTGWTKLMFVFDLVTREDSCPIPNRNRD